MEYDSSSSFSVTLWTDFRSNLLLLLRSSTLCLIITASLSSRITPAQAISHTNLPRHLRLFNQLRLHQAVVTALSGFANYAHKMPSRSSFGRSNRKKRVLQTHCCVCGTQVARIWRFTTPSLISLSIVSQSLYCTCLNTLCSHSCEIPCWILLVSTTTDGAQLLVDSDVVREICSWRFLQTLPVRFYASVVSRWLHLVVDLCLSVGLFDVTGVVVCIPGREHCEHSTPQCHLCSSV